MRMTANQQGGEQCSKASRIRGWWDEETHRGYRNKHTWMGNNCERGIVFFRRKLFLRWDCLILYFMYHTSRKLHILGRRGLSDTWCIPIYLWANSRGRCISKSICSMWAWNPRLRCSNQRAGGSMYHFPKAQPMKRYNMRFNLVSPPLHVKCHLNFSFF